MKLNMMLVAVALMAGASMVSAQTTAPELPTLSFEQIKAAAQTQASAEAQKTPQPKDVAPAPIDGAPPQDQLSPEEYHLDLSILLWLNSNMTTEQIAWKDLRVTPATKLRNLWDTYIGPPYDTDGVDSLIKTLSQDPLFGPCLQQHDLKQRLECANTCGDLQTYDDLYQEFLGLCPGGALDGKKGFGR